MNWTKGRDVWHGFLTEGAILSVCGGFRRTREAKREDNPPHLKACLRCVDVQMASSRRRKNESTR
jgi:hypothetical protein